MLWGKKVLHWSKSPQEALEILIDLNNKYALDGRDPNSYTGIFWCLGRYDRPWPPERPVFGSIRYMSSESTRRKLKVDGYVARWGRTGADEAFMIIERSCRGDLTLTPLLKERGFEFVEFVFLSLSPSGRRHREGAGG